MSNTSNLVLPYLAVGQAQKHVTVNETLRRLDAVVQLSVVSASTTAEPGSPTDGAVYIVPSGKSGASWSSFANWSLGYYRDGAWEQVSPREGWLAYVKDTDLLLHYTGSTWQLFAPGKLLTLSASDKLVGRATSGAGVAEEITCTAAGRALLDDADAAAQLATLGTWRVLAASAVAASVTGTTTETALATITLPGGAMGTNGILRVTSIFSYTNSANNKNIRMRLGGSGLSGTQLQNVTVSSTSGIMLQRVMQNRNAQNSQVLGASATNTSYGTFGAAPITSGVDTSSDQPIVLSGQLSNSGETLTLESYVIEVQQRA